MLALCFTADDITCRICNEKMSEKTHIFSYPLNYS